MTRHRLYPALSVLALAATVLACSFGSARPTTAPAGGATSPAGPSSTSAPNPPTGGGNGSTPEACQNKYYPVVKGGTWDYSMTGAVTSQYTRSITDVRPAGFSEQTVFASGPTTTSEWQCDDGALVDLQPSAAASATFQSSSGMSMNFALFILLRHDGGKAVGLAVIGNDLLDLPEQGAGQVLFQRLELFFGVLHVPAVFIHLLFELLCLGGPLLRRKRRQLRLDGGLLLFQLLLFGGYLRLVLVGLCLEARPGCLAGCRFATDPGDVRIADPDGLGCLDRLDLFLFQSRQNGWCRGC